MTRTHFTRAILVTVGLAPFTAFAQPAMNHLTCFGVKDSAPRAKYQATITTAAGSQTCTVKTPAKVACVPSSKTNVSPSPPGGGPDGSSAEGSFLCYRAKCPKAVISTNADDQFGARVISIKASRFVCTPAAVTAPPVGLPTSTSTTIPGTPNSCHFADGTCTGTCGGGQRCGTAVGSGSCECRNVSCGDADSPECNGACKQAGEACVFSFSGCSCVRIP